MLELDSKLTLNKDTIDAPNLCERFSADDLKKVGAWCSTGYKQDKQSRAGWEKRTAAAMDLAMQISEGKNFPWANCSNIAFPLVTIATMQFHAKAYPATIDGKDVVRCRVIGDDPDGAKKARAQRVGTHMSWQRLEQDQPWEESQDRMLINLACVGTTFKKSYHSSLENYSVSELVYAQNLVLSYWSKSVESSPRKTHIIPMFRNEIYERTQRDTFRDVREMGWYTSMPQVVSNALRAQNDNRHGVSPPGQADETTPFQMHEQHCLLDLDKDGYAEPYIITYEESSQDVLRIVTRFDREEDIDKRANGDIISVRAMEYFTKYSFLPSPDGGIYDVGFGVLLGPLNEATNSLVNQLVDAGTMSNAAGGFLGKGAKLRGGVYTFAPLEWKRVDSTGDDLRKSIFPLPVREPSMVLFQLLSLIVNYSNRIGGSNDTMVGENPGQNTPAETTRTMVEMGMKIYSAIFKRVWRSMKEEFKKLYILNGINLPLQGESFPGGKALREDYLPSPKDIIPAADPNVVSEAERVQLAVAIAQRSTMVAGYDPDAVERNLLKAMRVDSIDTLYGGAQKFPPPPNIKIQVEQIKLQGQQMALQAEQSRFVAQLLEDQRVNNAKIIELGASALEMKANADNEQAWAMVAAVEASIKMMQTRNNAISKKIELILKEIEIRGKIADGGGVARVAVDAGDTVAAQVGPAAPADATGAVV